MKHPIVTLLTDFGDADGFVGAMRGVILGRAPAAQLVDLAHHVPRGDVDKAARVLARAAPCFPPGTMHCVVVDPGVGSSRRAIAVQAGGFGFVAPDNGVLGDVLTELADPAAEAREITHPALRIEPVSATFHGRDVFGPAAAALAAGFPFADVGPRVEPVPHHRPPVVTGPDGRRRGRVIEVDTFGNLITDLHVEPDERVRVRVAGITFTGPAPAYAAVAPGKPVLVRGSLGTLEVAVRDGSAAARLGVIAGAPVDCVPCRPADDDGEWPA